MKGDLNEREVGLTSEPEESRYILRRTVAFSLPFSAFKRTILLFKKQ
jgi:hypothetical protein